LRVAFLNSWSRSPCEGSGTAVAIAGHEQGLRALGFEVDSLLPPTRAPGETLRRLAYNLSLRGHIRDERYERIVGFDIDGLFVPKSLTHKYFVCLKGICADEARFERGVRRLKLRLLSLLERLNVRKAYRTIVTSQYSRDKAIQAYGVSPDNLEVVPEGIDLNDWRGSCAEFVQKSKRRIILNVARQYARKDTKTLLRALPIVRELVPDVQARIVGDGPELRSLQRLSQELGVSEIAEFLEGLNSREAMRRQYCEAEIFCMPSLQEGFGIVFLEAMAAGLPIVAVRGGAAPEVLGEDQVGFLVSPSDPEELAGRLVQLLQDEELRRRFGEAGRKRVEFFDIDKVSRRFASVLELVQP
jgi:glycosyltransferase involved in cell wall biosynthesis